MDTLERMRADWEQRAHEDPLHYIAKGKRDPAAFDRSAAPDVAKILHGVQCGGRVLEIGAGIGRLLVAMENRFDELAGVDISPRMVELSRDYLAAHPKIRVEQNDGATLPFDGESFDLVFSYITFQHIPDRRIVERYIAEAHRVLKPSGCLRFQVVHRTAKQALTRTLRIERPSTWKGYNWTRLSLDRSLHSSPFPVFAVERDGGLLWATCARGGVGVGQSSGAVSLQTTPSHSSSGAG